MTHTNRRAKRAWATRFGLTEKQRRDLRAADLEQLRNCKDDAIRRIILGVSRERYCEVLMEVRRRDVERMMALAERLRA